MSHSAALNSYTGGVISNLLQSEGGLTLKISSTLRESRKSYFSLRKSFLLSIKFLKTQS